MKGLLFIAAVLCGTETGGRPIAFLCSVVNTAQTITVWMKPAAVNHCLCETACVCIVVQYLNCREHQCYLLFGKMLI